MRPTVPVSVIVPFHDGQAYAGEALASIRSQTVRPAEVVFVDDGSSPDGRAFLDALLEDAEAERGHHRSTGTPLRLIRLRENLGPGAARNAGVGAATQPYVAFLDVDDLWLEGKLERQLGLMRAWPELDATHTEVVFFRKDGSELRRDPIPRLLSITTALSRHVMMTPSVMLKRASFERLGGFDPSFRCTQDWELQIRMAKAGWRVQHIPDVLVRVRREDHGNHSANWRCYLAGHLGILWKHRALYRERIGIRGWTHRAALEAFRAGVKQGGWLGRCLGIPYRIGV